MHLIQSLKNEFCFDLPMFSKYLATSINSYFYKMTLLNSTKIDFLKVHNELEKSRNLIPPDLFFSWKNRPLKNRG